MPMMETTVETVPRVARGTESEAILRMAYQLNFGYELEQDWSIPTFEEWLEGNNLAIRVAREEADN